MILIVKFYFVKVNMKGLKKNLKLMIKVKSRSKDVKEPHVGLPAFLGKNNNSK